MKYIWAFIVNIVVAIINFKMGPNGWLLLANIIIFLALLAMFSDSISDMAIRSVGRSFRDED